MEPALRAVDVGKQFRIRKDRALKERIVNARRGRRHAEEFWAVRNITVDVDEGSTLGLIGHNGSGKSTLLKLLGGILTPTTGYVESRGRIAALLELGAGFHPDLTGRENVYLNSSILGISKAETDGYFDEIAAFSGIEDFLETQVKFYSSGMYVRLAFAVAVHVDPDVLLVDEVLAVGDEPFQQKCLARIRDFQKQGRTILLVTHALDLIPTFCSRAIVLDHGNVIHDGDPLDATLHLRQTFATGEGTPERKHPEVRVTSARVVGDRGTHVSEVSGREPVVLEVEVAAERPVTDWSVTVSVATTDDVVLYATSTYLLGEVLEPLATSAVVRFRFDALPFFSGTYFFHIAVGPVVGPSYTRVPRAVGVHVVGEPGFTGLVHLPAALVDVRTPD